MPLILAIQIQSASRGKFEIPLADAFKPPFSKFFRVDSFNLIVGHNGAGKTTILTDLAQFLAAPDRHSGFALNDNEQGLVQLKIQLEDLPKPEGENRKFGSLGDTGVVFYTPLPYRRNMLRSQYLRDASPTYHQDEMQVDPNIFRNIAAKLGITTELYGALSFSPTWIANAIAAELLTHSHQRLHAEPVDFELDLLSIAKAEFQAAEEAMQNDLDDEAREEANTAITESKRKLRLAQRHFSTALFSFIEENFPSRLSHPLLALAIFEWLARPDTNDRSLTRAFLRLIGLAEFAFSTQREEMELLAAIDEHIDFFPWFQLEKGRSSLEFAINDATYEKLVAMQRRRATAIRLSWTQLPSGLIALLDQFSRIQVEVTRLIDAGCRYVMLLIDEGEAYLHMDWQRKYVKLLDEFLGTIKESYARNNHLIRIQVLVATHSLVLAGDLPTAMITNLSQETPNVRTFAAPLDQLAFRFFGSYSIGEFATEKIRSLHERIKSGDHTEDDVALISHIGDGGIRNALLRTLNEHQSDTEDRP